MTETEKTSTSFEPVRILQVGLGAWGRTWADVVREVREVEPVGWVDANPAAFAAAPAGVRTFDSLQEALSAPSGAGMPDAVLVSAGLHAHAPIARAALEAGLHVLVEKPFTPTLHEAAELVRLAAERDRILMVSQNYRFHAAPPKVASLLREERIGPVGMVRIDFRKFHRNPHDHPYRRGLQPLLLDMFVHHADLMRFVLGREPIAVQCSSWNPPWSTFDDPSTATMAVDFGAGLVVTWHGSWESKAPATLWSGEWAIEGKKGVIEWSSRGDMDDPRFLDRIAIRRGDEVERVELAPMARQDRHAALAAFAEAIRTGTPPATSGRDNLDTLRLCLAAIRSAAEGRRVAIEELAAGPLVGGRAG